MRSAPGRSNVMLALRSTVFTPIWRFMILLV
jgi:hypothetical protein